MLYGNTRTQFVLHMGNFNTAAINTIAEVMTLLANMCRAYVLACYDDGKDLKTLGVYGDLPMARATDFTLNIIRHRGLEELPVVSIGGPVLFAALNRSGFNTEDGKVLYDVQSEQAFEVVDMLLGVERPAEHAT